MITHNAAASTHSYMSGHCRTAFPTTCSNASAQAADNWWSEHLGRAGQRWSRGDLNVCSGCERN